MTIHVDQDRCIGSGNCALSAPTLFDQRDDDGIAVVLDADPPDAEPARQAADLCPAAAISVTA